MSGIFDAPSQAEVTASLNTRAARRLRDMSDEALYGALAEAVYLERRRFEGGDDPAVGELEAIEEAARALHGGRAEQEAALQGLVALYAGEIHNRFSPRTYAFATRVLPRALTALFTAGGNPSAVFLGDFNPADRVVVAGPLDKLRRLAQTHTLIVAPTHVSNLDSPLLGYALYAAGLPPVVYGAGLNLFSNPLMSFFMSRLGAYTVDRRKKHSIYKDVLKDYSVDVLSRRSHSLFFPGGTRSRSGRIETRIKKGLLGTGLQAWQEGLAQGRLDPEILVVPCVLSCGLVLEAETLIEESLKEEGRQRYIISDDEFADSRVVASFLRRLADMDASVHIRFGEPLDVLGNPVDDAGQTLDATGEVVDRRGYVVDANGGVVTDPQRDHVYTGLLARALERAYLRDNTALSTHVAAFAAWSLLRLQNPRLNVFQTVQLGPQERRISGPVLRHAVDRLRERLAALE